MPICSLQTITVFKHINLNDDERVIWLKKNFPTVELRAKLRPNNSDHPFKSQIQGYLGSCPITILAEPHEGSQQVIDELLICILEILKILGQDKDDERVKERFLRVLTEMMPFGIPIQTSPQALLCNFIEIENSNNSFSIPGRAFPNWFAGSLPLEVDLSRIASSVLNRPDVALSLVEEISVISYRCEEEFASDLDVSECAVINSSILCRSQSRVPMEASFALSPIRKADLRISSECVQRVDADVSGNERIQVTFIPPPQLPILPNNSAIEICRFSIEEYNGFYKGISSHPQQELGSKRLDDLTKQIKLPIKVTYRLRKASAPTNSNHVEFQIITRVNLIAEQGILPDVKRLKIVMAMPEDLVISFIKLQTTCGVLTHRQSLLEWDLTASLASAPTGLLSGIVICDTHLNDQLDRFLLHETSCAFVEFELEGSPQATSTGVKLSVFSLNGQEQKVGIEHRTLKTNRWIVWNPFGDYPRGVPLEILYQRCMNVS